MPTDRRTKAELLQEIRRQERVNSALRDKIISEQARRLRYSQELFDKRVRITTLTSQRDSAVRKLNAKPKKPKLNVVQQGLMGTAEAILPEALHKATEEIVLDGSMSESLMALTERSSEFKSTAAMMMVGIGSNLQARLHLDAAIDAYWASTKPEISGTVVVGSGVHAAIYAMAHLKAKKERVTVVERSERAGGTFALTKRPAFYLNSRNRSGPLSVPGADFGALNVLPGSPFQPSDLGGEEYMTNDVLAYVVRMMLLISADVVTSYSVSPDALVPKKIVEATGLGDSRYITGEKLSDRHLSFAEFMKRMDDPFPLRGFERVAVLGAGDGGKTVIEALTGQGPSTRFSSASLDSPDVIDWYGVPEEQRSREGWERCNRSRYKGIARVLPRAEAFSPYQVVCENKASTVYLGYETIRVEGTPYDYVIDCTGYGREPSEGTYVYSGNRVVGVKDGKVTRIGPAAQLPGEFAIKENAVSIFRYAELSAMAATI